MYFLPIHADKLTCARSCDAAGMLQAAFIRASKEAEELRMSKPPASAEERHLFDATLADTERHVEALGQFSPSSNQKTLFLPNDLSPMRFLSLAQLSC